MDDTACPEPGCTAPAETLDHTLIESTHGLVEHVRVACPRGHRFLMPTQMLPAQPYGWVREPAAIETPKHVGGFR
jgi:hypothetical protein